MKNLMKAAALALLLLPATHLHAQADKFAHLDIHTNAVCDQCKQRIESEMLYEKGVHAVKVDVAKEVIHVEYKATKTDPAKLREAVSKIGYLADDVQPNAAARKALPACCQMTKDEHDAPPPAPPVPSGAPETVPVPQH